MLNPYCNKTKQFPECSCSCKHHCGTYYTNTFKYRCICCGCDSNELLCFICSADIKDK